MARFSSSGVLDNTFGDFVSGTSGARRGYRLVDFGSNSSDYVSSMAIVSVNGTDRILVAGSRSSTSTSNDFAILRFNASDGSLDTGTTGDATLSDSFGTSGKQFINFNGGYDYAYGMAIQGDKIILAGSAASGAGSNDYDFALTRLYMDGTLDTSFGTSGKKTLNFFTSKSNAAYDIKIAPFTNDIVLAGTTSTSGATGNDLAVARFTADGAVDSTFGPLVSGSTTVHQGWNTVDVRSTDDSGRSVLIEDDGRIIVGGSSVSATAGDLTDFALARFNGDGSLDDGGANDSTPNDRFGTGGSPPTAGTVMTNFDFGSDEIMRSVLQINGRLVVVGYATTGGGLDFAVARYMPDGSLDTTFGQGGKFTTDFSGANDTAYAVALQSDGKILAGGVTGTSSAIVRYLPMNTLDVTVIPHAPTSLTVSNQTDASVILTWTDNSAVETGFVIQQSSDSGTTWTDVGTVGANVLTYQAGGLTDATGYQFRVMALNGTYRSDPTSAATTKTTSKSNPDYAYVGQVTHLRASGGSGSAVYIWSISKGDKPFVSGVGATFDFTPDSAGTYYVTTYTQDGGSTATSTQTITVKDQALKGVVLAGPSAGFDGHVIPFSVQLPPPTEPFSYFSQDAVSAIYHWSVTKNGDPFSVNAPELATFQLMPDEVPSTPTDASDTYVVTVTIGSGGASSTLSRTIKITKRPVEKEYITTATDTTANSRQGKSVVVQPDGKFLVGCNAPGSLVARFNADLSLDTTFGTGGFATFVDDHGNSDPDDDELIGNQIGKILLQPDGKIIAIGEAIVRYTADGQLDPTFDNRWKDIPQLVSVPPTAPSQKGSGL